MIKLQSVELSAPFKLAVRETVLMSIVVEKHCKDLELNEVTGVITITTKDDKKVYTSLSNAKAAYGVTETSGDTLGTEGKTAGRKPKQA